MSSPAAAAAPVPAVQGRTVPGSVDAVQAAATIEGRIRGVTCHLEPGHFTGHPRLHLTWRTSVFQDNQGLGEGEDGEVAGPDSSESYPASVFLLLNIK